MKKNFRLLRIILVGIFLLALAWLVRENWKSESREAGAPFFRMAGSFRNFFGLNERSAELEAQKEELRIKLESLEARESEFKDLEKFLVAERPSGKIALIVSQALSSPYDTLLLSAGREDGVTAGFKALAYGGIFLGKVEESGERTSLVKLISFPGLQSEAWLERLALNVTLEGQGGYNLRFFLPKSAVVQIGERVLSNTRPSFIIGQVERINEKTSEPLAEIILRLPLNIRNLRYVELLP